MAQSFPKLKRLDNPARPDAVGTADSPIGYLLAAWQGPLLVRLQILPAGAEKRVPEIMADWGWGKTTTRDDKRAEKLVSHVLFPKGIWTGKFPADLQIGFNGTDFQWTIMQKMLKIPSGKTQSYGAVANAASVPGAARAVGTICAKNPVCLIIPCHRVLAAGGALGGYGYGSALKRQLLDWEK